MQKTFGLPIAEDLPPASDFPHTLSLALMYRARINSYSELPKDKQPPRDLWSKPHKMDEFIENVYKPDSGDGQSKGKTYIEFNPEEVEG